MKSLTALWKIVAQECATWCCTSAIRDYKTVADRTEHEGLSFLTITLPTFGKDFEKGLARGYVDRSLFTGFSWRAGLPQFLGGFLDRVFDRTSGVLVDDPCVDSIRSVRQLSLMFGKLALDCSESRFKDAMQAYVNCEQEVRHSDSDLSARNKADFIRLSDMLYARAFTAVDRKVFDNSLVPKHGPGATADRLRGNSKYQLGTWTYRLEKVLPSGEYLLPNWSYYDQLDGIELLEPGMETPVRVVSVPKTLKTPRIIGIEPTCMQYAQQALLPAILEEVKRDDLLRSFLGFDDQRPNQELARLGSLTGELATLDLSEASDRVSNQHVRLLVRNHAHLFAAVDASRSRKADVPGFGVLRLAKFASMGSALCFPFEAMVFLTLVLLGIDRASSAPLTRAELFALRGKVRIYGDDIIVPVEYVRSVVEVLQAFGFVVNDGKSFWTGKFRESCGRDYYHGDDVSFVKVRRMFPTQLKDAQETISLVALRNQLYFAGYWQTCKWLDERLGRLLRNYPVVAATSPVLGRHSFLGYQTERTVAPLWSPQVRGHVVDHTIPASKLDGYGALLKCFHLMQGSASDSESPMSHLDVLSSMDDHLERSGRPRTVNTKFGWYSAF